MGPAELARALSRVEAELGKIDGKLDGLANTFVRKDVFDLHVLQLAHEAHRIAVEAEEAKGIAEALGKQQRDDRRLIFTALVAPLVVLIIGALVVAQLVGS